MLFNLLDGAVPTPLFLFMWLYETQPLLAVLIPVGFLIITMITIIAFASREKKEDKRNREKYKNEHKE